MLTGRPRLGVVYNRGAAGPAEIVKSLANIADVVLLIPDNEHTRRIAPLLASLNCDVHPIAPDTIPAGLPALDGAVTFSEKCLRLTTQITEFLGLPGHSRDAALALTDKSLQRQLLKSVDPVASVPVRSPNGIAAALSEVGLPAVIKPVRGEGSAFTTRVDTAAEAMAAAHAAWQAAPGRTLAVETYLAGIESPRSPRGHPVPWCRRGSRRTTAFVRRCLPGPPAGRVMSAQ